MAGFEDYLDPYVQSPGGGAPSPLGRYRPMPGAPAAPPLGYQGLGQGPGQPIQKRGYASPAGLSGLTDQGPAPGMPQALSYRPNAVPGGGLGGYRAQPPVEPPPQPVQRQAAPPIEPPTYGTPGAPMAPESQAPADLGADLAIRPDETPDQHLQRMRASGMGDVRAGWETGVLGLQQLAGGAAAALGDATGAEGLRDWGVDLYRRKEAEIKPFQEGRTTALEDIGSVGQAADWAQFTLGQVAPSIVESVGTALIGAAAGSAVPGAGNVAAGVGGLFAKGAVKRFLAERVAGSMAKGAAQDVAEAGAKRALAQQMGAGALMFGSSYVQGVGDVYGETMDEQGRGSAITAFLGGLPYAALDTVTDLSVLKSVVRGTDGEKALARYAKAMLTGAAKEGGAESGQEGLLLLAGLANGKEYDSAEVLSRLGNSFAAGALAGGVMGVGGGRQGPSDAQREQATLGNLAAVGLAARDGVQEVSTQDIAATLADPQTPAALRADAIALIAVALRERTPDLADLWTERAGAAFKAGQPIRVPTVLDDTRSRAADAQQAGMPAGGKGGDGQGREVPQGVGEGQGPAEDGGTTALGGGRGPVGPEDRAVSGDVGAGAGAETQGAVGPGGGAPAPRAVAEVDSAPSRTGEQGVTAQALELDPARIAWQREPLESEQIPGRDGATWTRELHRSKDGAYVVERAIGPDGEIARERVLPFPALARQRAAEAEADFQAQAEQMDAFAADPANAGASIPPEMAATLNRLAADRDRWTGLSGDADKPVVAQPQGQSPEAAKMEAAHAARLWKLLEGGQTKSGRRNKPRKKDLAEFAYLQGIRDALNGPDDVLRALRVRNGDEAQAQEVADAGTMGQGDGQEPTQAGAEPPTAQPEVGARGAGAQARGGAGESPAGAATGVYPVDMPQPADTGFRPDTRVRADDAARGGNGAVAGQAASAPAATVAKGQAFEKASIIKRTGKPGGARVVVEAVADGQVTYRHTDYRNSKGVWRQDSAATRRTVPVEDFQASGWQPAQTGQEEADAATTGPLAGQAGQRGPGQGAPTADASGPTAAPAGTGPDAGIQPGVRASVRGETAGLEGAGAVGAGETAPQSGKESIPPQSGGTREEGDAVQGPTQMAAQAPVADTGGEAGAPAAQDQERLAEDAGELGGAQGESTEQGQPSLSPKDAAKLPEAELDALLKQFGTPEAEPAAVRVPRGGSARGAGTPRKPSAAKAGAALVEGTKDLADGILALFGGAGTMRSGPAFDEESYAKARPMFASAMQKYQEAGREFADWVGYLVGQGGQALLPYIRRFMGDVREGAVHVPGVNDEQYQAAQEATTNVQEPETKAPETAKDAETAETAAEASPVWGQLVERLAGNEWLAKVLNNGTNDQASIAIEIAGRAGDEITDAMTQAMDEGNNDIARQWGRLGQALRGDRPRIEDESGVEQRMEPLVAAVRQRLADDEAAASPAEGQTPQIPEPAEPTKPKTTEGPGAGAKPKKVKRPRAKRGQAKPKKPDGERVPRAEKDRGAGIVVVRPMDAIRRALAELRATDPKHYVRAVLKAATPGKVWKIPAQREGTNPGVLRAQEWLRNQIIGPLEFIGTYYGGSRDKHRDNFDDAIVGWLRDQERYGNLSQEEARAEFEGRVADYISTVEALGAKLSGASNVAQLAEAMSAFLTPDADNRQIFRVRAHQIDAADMETDWSRRGVGQGSVKKEADPYGERLIDMLRRPRKKNGEPIDNIFTYFLVESAELSPWYQFLARETEEIVEAVEPKRPLLKTIERRGFEDVRKGREIKSEDLMAEFGFAAVPVGDYVTSKSGSLHLNSSFEALHDLATLIGVDYKTDLSLGGALHYSIGRLGRGGKASAFFSPNWPIYRRSEDGKEVLGSDGMPIVEGHIKAINITRTTGDGSVAHEWGHALDDALQATPEGRRMVAQIKEALQRRWNADKLESVLDEILVGARTVSYEHDPSTKKGRLGAATDFLDRTWGRADFGVFEPTAYLAEAKKIGAYWERPEELWARSWESSLHDWMGAERRSDYLVDKWVSEGEVVGGNVYTGTPYPTGVERNQFSAIWREMLKHISWVDGKPVALGSFPDPLAQQKAQIETRIEALKAEVAKRYAALNGVQSPDGLYWYAYTEDRRGPGGQPLRYAGFDDSHQRGESAEPMGAVAYAEPLGPEEMRPYLLESIQHEANDKTVYLKEGEGDGGFDTVRDDGSVGLEEEPTAGVSGPGKGAQRPADGQPGAGDGTGRDEPTAGPGRPVQPGAGTGVRGDTAGTDGAGGAADAGAVPTAGAGNFHVLKPEELKATGQVAAFTDNLRAIRLLKQLEEEGRQATAEEQEILVRYHGWGGLAQVFSYYIRDAGWQKRADALRELLTAEEWSEAASSTQNANYTDPAVVQAMWATLERMGFKGGKVLDPSGGLGAFYTLMPKELERASKLMAIEKDALTARLLAQVLQNTAVKHSPFEEVRLPERYFDLVVSNVPFADVAPNDKKYNPNKRFLHDYFFLKSIELVRPGGIVAFITSRGTMDKIAKGGPQVRAELAGKADLIGAVRLPENAFKDAGMTTVTTDIIFLRRKAGEATDLTEAWGESKPMALPVPDDNPSWHGIDEEGGEPGRPYTKAANVNEYYHAHPEQMATAMIWRAGRYGNAYEPAMAPSDQPIGEVVIPLLARLPGNVLLEEGQAAFADESMYAIEAEVGDVKDGGFADQDGKLWVKREGMLYPLDPKTKPEAEARIRAYLGIMRARRAALNGELRQLSDAELKPLRKALRGQYDAFVKAFGALNLKENRNAFMADPDAPAVLALEHWDAETKTVTKLADIFTERVVAIRTAPTHADNALDALAAALNYRGRVDWGYMQGLTGQTFEATREALRGMVYNDPMSGWVSADAYLSGNVREKLVAAQVAAEVDDAYQENVAALEAVQPTDLTPEEIHANLGANWVPVETVRDFIAHLLGLNRVGKRALIVTYAKPTGQWHVQIGGENQAQARRNTQEIGEAVASRATWGTSRVPLLALMDYALNGGVPKVTDPVKYLDDAGKEQTRQVVNEQETEQARAKLEGLRDEFNRWVWDDQDRRETLGRLYNDARNAVVLRRYAHPYYEAGKPELAFPGQGPNERLRPYQAAFVWRVLQDLDAYAGHEVGTGKTFSMITAAMELKRTGVKKKPMFAVLGSTAGQFRSEFLRLYPNANVLTVHIGDNNRQRRVALGRIANNNWDAVIVTHESFNRIPVSPDTEMRRMTQELQDLEEALRAAQETDTTGGSYTSRGKAPKNITVKNLEKAKSRMQAKLKALGEIREKDQGTTFEDLGVDMLFVDEAQVYKNLAFYTKLQGQVKGLGTPEGSGAAWGLFMKARYIQDTFGGGLVLASGTPVSNSVAEVYTIQRYLDYPTLRASGLHHFDRWAAEYGDVGTASEYAPEGGGFREVVRFRRFYNAPEMLQAVYRRLDVLTAEEAGIPRPAMETGKPYQIVVPQTPALTAFQEELVERAKAYRRSPRKAEWNGKPDNMLNIVTDGRKAAMDMRMIDPAMPDEQESKTNKAVELVYQEYKRTTGIEVPNPKGSGTIKTNGVALVFADLGVPNKEGRFSIYDEIKAKLVKLGVPADEIAFAQETSGASDAKKAARAQQHARVRQAKIRVFIGSTSTMGTGVNVQDRVSMLLHMDVWWNLSNWLQRNGRGIRFGNLFPEVKVLNIGAERTVDTFVWDKVQQKGVIVDKILSKNLTERTIEDVSKDTMSAGEAMAVFSGDPRIKRQADLKADVRRMAALEKAYRDTKRQVRSNLTRGEAALQAKLAETPAAGEYQVQLDELAAEGALLIFEPKRATATAFAYQEDGQNRKTNEVVKKLVAAYRTEMERQRAKDIKIREDWDAAWEKEHPGKSAPEMYRPWRTHLKDVQIGVFASPSMTMTWTLRDDSGLAPRDDDLQFILATKLGKYEFRDDTTPRTLVNGVLGLVRDQNNERVKDIRNLRSEIPKLREEADKPFKHADELREKAAELDTLTKDLVLTTEDAAVVTDEADAGADQGEGVRFALGKHSITRQRTATGGGQVLKAAFLQGRINQLVRPWRGLLGLPVRVVQRERELPAAALAELARVRRENPNAFPKAVFVPGVVTGDYGVTTGSPAGSRGEILLVADNLRDVRDAVVRTLHEAVGHLGVRETFGPTFEGFLDELIADRSADVALYARQYGLDMKLLADRRVAAEELLAHMAETQADSDLPFLRRVFQAIRAWLRARGFQLRLSDGDLREVLVGARRYVERGDARGAMRVRERFGVRGGARAGGARFMFSGPRAKTADAMALKTAQARLKAGDDAEAVRQSTGWFRGDDGKWRFEIDDSGALIKGSEIKAKRIGAHTIKLGDLLIHDALFSAYPSLRDVSVRGSISKQNNSSGVLNTTQTGGKIVGFEIVVKATDGQQYKSILLHEIQHGIQHVEGFASGGNPENAYGMVEQPKLDAIRKKMADLKIDPYKIQNKMSGGYKLTDEEARKYREWEILRNQEDDVLGSTLTGYEAYKRLSGEVEARNTQVRQTLTADERRAQSPRSTQDVAPKDVIVVWNGKEMANAPMPENAGAAVGTEDARLKALLKQYANEAGAPSAAELAEAVRQYREVEDRNADVLRAHDERGEALPAPNGEASNLNREQWVLVRTPNFNRWFGDWQLSAMRDTLRDAMGSDLARRAAAKFLNQTLVNVDSGLSATVSQTALNKMLSGSAVGKSVSPQAHATAVANLDQLFPMALERLRRAPERNGDVGRLKAVRHFEVPMPFQGDVLRVKLLVKELTDAVQGNRLYTVAAVEIEKPASSRGESVSPEGDRSPAPPAGFTARFAQAVESVKGDGVSKVIDANGEPLVVYHGTSEKFTSFDEKLVSGQSKNEFGHGFYFAPTQDAAMLHAEHSSKRTSKPATVLGVFLKLQRPKYVPFADQGGATGWHGLHDGLIAFYNDAADRNNSEDWAELVAATGSQVKSADSNVGTYSDRGDIRFSLATDQRLAEDLQAQSTYLNQQAKAKGYPNVDTLLANDADAFERAAGDWRQAHQREFEDGTIRFSLDQADGGVAKGSAVIDDLADSRWQQAKQAFRDLGAKLRPAGLATLTLRQLAEVGEAALPGMQRYDELRRQMESFKNGMMEAAGSFAGEVFAPFVYGGKGRPILQYLRPKVAAAAKDMFNMVHAATLANEDPAEAHKPLTVQMTLEAGAPQRLVDVSRETLADLKARIARYEHDSEFSNRVPYLRGAIKRIEKLMPAELERLRQRPALVTQWNKLSKGKVYDNAGQGWASEDEARKAQAGIDANGEKRPTAAKRREDGRWVVQAYGAQEVYREIRDRYKEMDRKRFKALLDRIARATVLGEDEKKQLIAQMRRDYEASVTSSGQVKVQPYFPLYRSGQYYVAARKYRDGANEAAVFYQNDVTQEPYKTKAAAWSAANKRADLAGWDVRPVEMDGGGWRLVEYGEAFFGRYESPKEARLAKAALERDGYTVTRVGMIKQSTREVEGVSEGFIADAVDKLRESGDEDGADMLHQMYLAQLNELSQRTHFIHRKGVAGFEDSALAAFGHTMFHLSHQIAKSQYEPRLTEQLRVIEENGKEQVEAVQSDEYLGELRKRHEWVMNPDNAPWTTWTSSLGFLWYLGISPAAALVNLTQTPIIAYPALAARFDDWGGARKAMLGAFADLRKGMGKEAVKGFLTGKPHPTLPANLTEDERKAFDDWTVSGARDVTQAHNLAGIGDNDKWNNSPGVARAMGFVSSGFHMAEVVNRDVTLLATYRMARAKGQAHATAVQTADKITTDAHLDYANANRARIMQGNAAKVLFMFKSYSQGITYFLARALWQATAGESAAVKREARQRLLGALGMTALFSGTMGMPLLGGVFLTMNLVAAMFGDDDEPWDAEDEFRSFLARNLPGPVAAAIDRGPVNALTGLDFSSRVGLSDLWIREPNRDLDGSGMFQHIVEQAIGPIGSIAGAPFTAYDQLQEGHVTRALEAMVPKFARDGIKAMRYAAEGVTTRRGDPVLGGDDALNPWNLFWVGMGLQPDKVRAAWDTTNMLKTYEGRITDRRRMLQGALAMSIIEGDADARANVLPKIRQWNQTWADEPRLHITPRTVTASVRGRERYTERAKSGVSLNPGTEFLRERLGVR